MGSVHKNKRLVEAYLASFSGGNPKVIAGYVASDFRNEHLSLLGEGCESRAVYEVRLQDFLATFENLRYDIESCLVDDVQGAVHYTMRFQHGGASFYIGGMFWFTFRDGYIATRTDCWDGFQYAKQAGLSSGEIASLLD